jgi:hypothetical protein
MHKIEIPLLGNEKKNEWMFFKKGFFTLKANDEQEL